MALVQVGKTLLFTASSALAVTRGFKSTGYLSKVIKGVLRAKRLHFYSGESLVLRETQSSPLPELALESYRERQVLGKTKLIFLKKMSSYINT